MKRSNRPKKSWKRRGMHFSHVRKPGRKNSRKLGAHANDDVIPPEYLVESRKVLPCTGLCWLLVSSVGSMRPLRTPHSTASYLPIPQMKSTISSIHLLIFTEGERLPCRGF